MNPFRKNVAALSILQAANYLLPLISVPYLVRVLGSERFGEIAFAQSYVQYFLVLTDYGFNYSATKSVSVARDDPEQIGRLIRSVTTVKLLLMTAGAVVMAATMILVPRFRAAWPLFAVSYLAVAGSVLFPVWLFQGLERMGRIAALSLSARVLTLVCLFIFVRQPSDYIKAAGLQASALPLAGMLAIGLMGSQALSRIGLPTLAEIKSTLLEGWPLFLSTAAITLYTSSNIFILGLLEPTSTVAYYTAADKLTRASVGLLQPVTQALYPRMVFLFNRDLKDAFRYLKRITFPLTLLTGLVGACLYVAARPLVVLLFGSKMSAAAELVRILSPVALLVTWSNLLGVQLLFPLGFQSLVSRYQVFTGLISIAVLIPMVWEWGARGSAFNYVASEIAISAGFLLIALRVLKHRGGLHANAG